MALTTESAARKDATTAAGVPTLEHRHFAFIAATLNTCWPMPGTGEAKLAQWHDTVETFADACQRSNPRFDRARFLSACGVQS